MYRVSCQVKTHFIKNQNLNPAPEHRPISSQSIHPIQTATNTRMIGSATTETNAEMTAAIVIEKVSIIDPVQKKNEEMIIDLTIQAMYPEMEVMQTLHPFPNLLICKTEIGNVYSAVIGIGPKEAIVINVRRCKLRRREITVGLNPEHKRMTDIEKKIIDKEVKVVAVGVLRGPVVVVAVSVQRDKKVGAIVVIARVKMVVIGNNINNNNNNKLIAGYHVKGNNNINTAVLGLVATTIILIAMNRNKLCIMQETGFVESVKI